MGAHLTGLIKEKRSALVKQIIVKMNVEHTMGKSAIFKALSKKFAEDITKATLGGKPEAEVKEEKDDVKKDIKPDVKRSESQEVKKEVKTEVKKEEDRKRKLSGGKGEDKDAKKVKEDVER